MKERLATLISGGGTTMEAIIKACQSGEIPMDVACVIASSPHAGGIEKARKLGIPVAIINPKDFRDNGRVNQESFGDKILQELKAQNST